MIGIPTQGCNAESLRSLMGDDYAKQKQLLLLMRRIRQQSVDTATQDERYRQLLAEWRVCMKTAGHDLPDPLGADILVQSEAPSGGFGAHPAFIASIDCKARNNFTARAKSLLAEHETRRLDASPGAIDEWKRIEKTSTDNAERVLREMGATGG